MWLSAWPAFGGSGNGETIVGYANSALGQEAFRWTAATGMVGLGDLAGGIYSSEAWGGNGDGALIVGSGNTDLGDRRIWNGRPSFGTPCPECGTCAACWKQSTAWT